MAQRNARQSDTTLEVLRAKTHEAHEKLHEHATFVALFKQTITLDQYRALMQRYYGFYIPLDQAITKAIGGSADAYDYALRADYLRQDLVDLGLSAQAIKDSPTCEALADIVTPASIGGVLYVVEGSTLGAASIDRAAHKVLDGDQALGRQFWAWSRAHNKQRWSMTTRFLAHLDTTARPRAPIIAGACATFDALDKWLAPLNRPADAPHELCA